MCPFSATVNYQRVLQCASDKVLCSIKAAADWCWLERMVVCRINLL